jgi:hypothetical protein
MKRAKEQGFDTDTTMYHGTRSKTEQGEAPDIQEFQTTKYGAAEGTYLTPSTQDVNRYASSPIYPGGTIYPVHTSGKIGSRKDMLDASGVNSTEKTASMKEKGLNGYFDEVHREMVMFDPAKIRSRYAAFDPDNIGKSALLGSLAAGAILSGKGQKAEAGEIKAPKNQKTLALANGIRALEGKLKGHPAGMLVPTGTADWLYKMAYDQKSSNKDKLNVLMDFL